MTRVAAVARRPSSPVRALFLLFLLTAGVMATAFSAVISDGHPLVVIAPLAAAVMLAAIWVAPLRKPLLIVIFFGLALDKPTDAVGLNSWHSPLAPLGGLLIDNLNKTVNIPALKVSLLILLLGYLLLIRTTRVLRGPGAAEPGTVPAARPFYWSLVASLATVVAIGAYGMARGGDVQMVKIQVQVFLPLLAMAYLLSVSLRGVRDYRVLAKLIVAAACIKAAMAIWVRLMHSEIFVRSDAYATSHGDSLLFVSALAILAAGFIERPTRRMFPVLVTIGPIIVAGMIANNRRLAWVQLALSIAIILVVNVRGWAVRALARTAIYLSPLLLVYCAVGWESSSKVFAPVQILRSITDSDANRSTWFRDVENYNLVYTFRRHPIFGTGFGHPFETAAENDALNFEEYPYLPHNSVLGLWAFGGLVGFTGLWSALVVGLMLAARSYRFARMPEQRAAACVAMANIVAYVLHCWGDIGFTEPKTIFLTGAALAVAGQLACSTGAWRMATPRVMRSASPLHARG